MQLDKFRIWIQAIWLQSWQSYPLSLELMVKFHAFFWSRSLICWCIVIIEKNSLREVIFLTVNSTLINFPLDRMAIFSSAKDMTQLKVEWVTKWKIRELGKSCGIIWGKLRTWGTWSNAILMSAGKGLEVLQGKGLEVLQTRMDFLDLSLWCSELVFLFFYAPSDMCLPQITSH